MLRDPVERTLSYLRHHQKVTPADRDRSAGGDLRRPLPISRSRSQPHGQDVLVEAGGDDRRRSDGVDFTPERLEQAKANLSGVDAIGLQEHFGEFCDELVRRFGWRFGEPERVNSTPPVPVSDAFRADRR